VWAYSPKRITRTAAGTVRMWLKQTPPRDGVAAARAELIRKREENQLTTRGYDRWQYSLILFELKCRERKSRFVTRTDYDGDGQVLATDEGAGKWNDIFPDSVAERMLDVGCKPVSTPKPRRRK